MLVARSDVAARLAADWRFLLMVGSGLMLQVAHPAIGSAVGEHSTYAADPFGRLRRSLWPVLGMVLLDDGVEDYCKDLRSMHRDIAGVDHLGRRYHAWDPEAAFFVLATSYYAGEQMAEIFGTPLTPAERQSAYASWKQAGLNFGIPERAIPSDLEAFEPWFENIIETRLERNPTTQELLSTLRSPAPPPGVPVVVWALIAPTLSRLVIMLTVGTLPPAARDKLGLTWDARNQRSLDRFAALVRFANRLMPRPLREINRVIVRRQRSWMLEYAAKGAELGIAPSIAGLAAINHGDSNEAV